MRFRWVVVLARWHRSNAKRLLARSRRPPNDAKTSHPPRDVGIVDALDAHASVFDPAREVASSHGAVALPSVRTELAGADRCAQHPRRACGEACGIGKGQELVVGAVWTLGRERVEESDDRDGDRKHARITRLHGLPPFVDRRRATRE
jgi:hypothetical protein